MVPVMGAATRHLSCWKIANGSVWIRQCGGRVRVSTAALYYHYREFTGLGTEFYFRYFLQSYLPTTFRGEVDRFAILPTGPVRIRRENRDNRTNTVSVDHDSRPSIPGRAHVCNLRVTIRHSEVVSLQNAQILAKAGP